MSDTDESAAQSNPESQTPGELRWLAGGDNFDQGTKAVMRRGADEIEQLERELAEAKAERDKLRSALANCANRLAGVPRAYAAQFTDEQLVAQADAALAAEEEE